ncbi:MAG: PQQ-binding-like beta-propeller repeat protein [Armatimonadota bacterium]
MIYKRLVIALVMVLAVGAVAHAAESDWTMARYDEAQTGYTPQQLTVPLTLYWQHNTTKSANNTSAPAVVGDTTYFSSGDRVYAVDTATGSLKWRFPSGSDALRSAVKTGITAWEDMVFFGGMDGKLYALNAATGLMAWTFSAESAIRSTPVVSNGTIFVGSDDNNLYAIDARSGELSWTGGFRTNDDVAASPAISPGIVVFTSLDTTVYAANSATGKIRWTYRLPSVDTQSGPVVSGNLVFIPAGNSIHVLSVKSGQLRYVINLQSDVSAPIAIAGSDVYVVCRNLKLYAYKAGLNAAKPKWAAAADLKMAVSAPPTVAGDTVFVGTKRGTVCAFSADTGNLLWNYTATPSIIGNNNQPASYTSISAPLVAAGNSLLVLTDDGSLRCFKNDAPDNTSPKLYNVMPHLGTAMSGHPPIQISAILYDESTGINPDSIQLLLDEEKVDYTFDPSTMKISYITPITSPVRPLSDGRHILTIIADDWKGNEIKHTWSFVVDNSMPPPKVVVKDKTKIKKPVTRPQPPVPSVSTTPAAPGGSTNPGGGPGSSPNPGQGPGSQPSPGAWGGDGPPSPPGQGGPGGMP